MKKAKAMERNIKINYWWRCSKFPNGIPPELAEALEESAMDRILEQAKEGYVSGELLDNVCMDIEGEKTPTDGWECSGGWSLQKEDV